MRQRGNINNFKVTEFLDRQAKSAHGLLDGTYQLLVWPAEITRNKCLDCSHNVFAPSQTATAAAHHALATFNESYRVNQRYKRHVSNTVVHSHAPTPPSHRSAQAAKKGSHRSTQIAPDNSCSPQAALDDDDFPFLPQLSKIGPCNDSNLGLYNHYKTILPPSSIFSVGAHQIVQIPASRAETILASWKRRRFFHFELNLDQSEFVVAGSLRTRTWASQCLSLVAPSSVAEHLVTYARDRGSLDDPVYLISNTVSSQWNYMNDAAYDEVSDRLDYIDAMARYTASTAANHARFVIELSALRDSRFTATGVCAVFDRGVKASDSEITATYGWDFWATHRRLRGIPSVRNVPPEVLHS